MRSLLYLHSSSMVHKLRVMYPDDNRQAKKNEKYKAATRGDQKVRGKVLLYHSAFIDCNKNSQIETTIHSKLTEIKI